MTTPIRISRRQVRITGATVKVFDGRRELTGCRLDGGVEVL